MSGYVPLQEEGDTGSPGTASSPKQKRTFNRCLAVLGNLVFSVASSSTDTKVVAGDDEGKVTMLDAESGATLWQTKLGDRVYSVAFSSTDTKVVASDGEGKVTMLDAESGATLWQTELGGMVYSVAFSSTTDTKVVAGNSFSQVTMLDAESGATLWQTELGGQVQSVAFSSTTDTKVVAGDDEGKVTMLDAESGATLWQTELGGEVLGVAFSSTTDTKVVASDNEGKVTMLDAESGATLWQTKLGGDVYSVAFSSTTDTKVVAGDDEGKVTMLDAESGATLWQAELGDVVRSVAFSSTTNTKVVAGDHEGKVTMLDAESGATRWETGLRWPVPSVAFSSTTDTKVVAGDFEGKVTMLDAESGATLWQQTELGCMVYSVAFSSTTDTKVVAGDHEGKVTMLDAESGVTLWQTKLGAGVKSVAFSSTTDTKVVAGDWDGKVTMLDAESGATLWQTKLGGDVYSVAFSSTTDTKVVAGDDEGKVTMLDTASGATLWQTKLGGDVYSVAFSSTTDTKVVAGDGKGKVTMLDAESGATLWQTELGDGVRSVAFSSTTNTKVVASDGEGKVTMLDAESGATLWQTKLGVIVLSIAFSSTTDTKVVASDMEGKVTLFNLVDEIMLTRIEDSLRSLDISALCNVVPRTSLLCGTSLGGRSIAAMLAEQSEAQGAVQFIEWLQQHCSHGERAAAAAALLQRDNDGFNALEYAMSTRKTVVVQAFIDFLLRFASPNTLDLLLTKGVTELSSLEGVVESYTPLLVAALAGRPLCPYAHSEAMSVSRYSAALLDADRSRVRLRGATVPADLITQRFWDDSGKEAADAVDVICGVPLLPGLTRADSSAFEMIVKSADLRLIASEPVRAAIAFKWAAYGRNRWYQQVGWYAGYVGGFLGGIGLLLLSQTNIEPFNGEVLGGEESFNSRLLGALLFAATWLINLVYLREEVAEVRSLGVRKYLSSLTDLVDASLHGLVLLLAPVLMINSRSASSIAAVATVLLFLKGQKVLRGNEGMSFLVNMLYEIMLDMRAFLIIEFGAVVLNAFAFRLLRGDTDTYASFSASLFSSYALLMHGEGVGELDLYMDSMLTATFLISITLLVDIVMLNALIAIMSDTYDRVSETRVEMGLLGQAQLLVDIEEAMNDTDRLNKDYFPKWLHVIRIKDADGVDDGWSGRLRAIKSKIDSVEEAIQQKAGAVKQKVGAVEHKIVGAVEKKVGAVEQNVRAVEQKVGSVEQKVGSVEQKMGAVEQKVSAVEQQVGAVQQQVGAVEQKLDILIQLMKDMAPPSRSSMYRLGHSLSRNI